MQPQDQENEKNTTPPLKELTIVPTNSTGGIFKMGIPCEPGGTNTLQTVGIQLKMFLGREYEMCFTKTQAAKAPDDADSGTPLFVKSSNWAYIDTTGTSDITVLSYAINDYTKNYQDGGVTYTTKEGKSCTSQAGKPKPAIEDYVQADFTCS
ncbi:hypothetical protein HZC07_00245 [Candidatus Micrarchaeota archaeon]|nr:hypothetical protein [Candidatus Micrarchaeota archaeon]